jgi:hypothetical protein
MGPRLRGDDKENPSLDVGEMATEPAKFTLYVECQYVCPDSPASARGMRFPPDGLRSSVGGA